MSAYRNITCDPHQPKTSRDRTAAGLLTVLETNVGIRVEVDQVDQAVRAAGGSTRRKAEAVKALRNVGYPIIAKQARHHSWYKLDGTMTEYEDHRQDVIRAAYSRQVTTCRELDAAAQAVPNDLSLAACLRQSQIAAINLGSDRAVGLSIQEVIEELAPL